MVTAILPMKRLLPLATLLLMLLGPSSAFAQREEIFGTGKPPVFREENLDRKFLRTKFAKMLAAGTEEPGCVQLLSGLFMVLGEIAPSLHKRDENFLLAPELQEVLSTQLSTPQFPAMTYLVAMVRRIHLDHRMPDEWLETAKTLNQKAKVIDLAKLKFLNDNVTYVDSSYFSIPVLRERYVIEYLNTNSAVTNDVGAAFRDNYLDRDVVWGGARLVDAGLNAGKKKKPKVVAGEAAELLAVLEWLPAEPKNQEINLLAKKVEKVKPIRIYARLAPKQYIDLEKAFRGQRMMVRGRFWEMTKTLSELEVRDVVLFEDRDFSGGVRLADPAAVASCSVAFNELAGVLSSGTKR
jgi:hypothetical protein